MCNLSPRKYNSINKKANMKTFQTFISKFEQFNYFGHRKKPQKLS